MTVPSAARKLVLVTRRATGNAPVSYIAISARQVPEIRTTPIPPTPGGVAIAAITSLEYAFMWSETQTRYGVMSTPKRYFLAAPSIMRVICHCWPIDSKLFTTQYKTSPAGKNRNIPVNTIGIIHMILA